MVIEFEAVVEPASKLRSILEVIQGIYDTDAKMHVNHLHILITVLNGTASAPITIYLDSKWFKTYNLNIPDGLSRTISFSAHSLCNFLFRRTEDGDTLTIKGDLNQDSSVARPLFLDFTNPNHGYRRFSLNVRGSEPPLSVPPSSHVGRLQFNIRPSSLFAVLYLCYQNREAFYLTLSRDAVRVAIGQQYSYTLAKGARSEYILNNFQVEGGGRTCVLEVHPHDTDHFRRAIVRSKHILVVTSPPALLPQPWPSIAAIIAPDLVWFMFSPSSLTSAM